MPQITLPQGTVRYEEIGAGAPVVFVHGVLVDGTLWDLVTPRLAGDLRCVVPDLPLGSHRIALEPDADRTPQGVAQLVGDFIAALDLRDVTLVANDTGGAIAQLVALDHGERLGRLVFTNCDCFEVFPPREFAALMKAAHVPGALYAALQPLRAAAVRRRRQGYGALARELPDELTGAWVAPFLSDAGVRRDTVDFLKAVDKAITLDAAARLPSLRIPSLVAWGQDDRFFPPELGRRLAAVLPDARLEPIAGSRTFVARDAPGELADAIRAFVRETTAQAAA
jgi:pimeloyl-ACP methyl ester carboxylesterase